MKEQEKELLASFRILSGLAFPLVELPPEALRAVRTIAVRQAVRLCRSLLDAGDHAGAYPLELMQEANGLAFLCEESGLDEAEPLRILLEGLATFSLWGSTADLQEALAQAADR